MSKLKTVYMSMIAMGFFKQLRIINDTEYEHKKMILTCVCTLNHYILNGQALYNTDVLM